MAHQSVRKLLAIMLGPWTPKKGRLSQKQPTAEIREELLLKILREERIASKWRFQWPPKTRKACTMVTHLVIPCMAWDHVVMTAGFDPLESICWTHRPWGGGPAWGRVCRTRSSSTQHQWVPRQLLDGLGRVQRGFRVWTVWCQRHWGGVGTATRGEPLGMLKRPTISSLNPTAVGIFLKFCCCCFFFPPFPCTNRKTQDRRRQGIISKSQYEKKSLSLRV